MKIELARYSGFCMGVRDAILEIVSELNGTDEEVYVYGPLIHNPQTVDILSRRGLTTINDLNDIDDKVIAIRTHGIPIEKLREIKKRSKRYLNLTCPRVSRVQGLIKSYSQKGYFTIIIGDREHAEVLGLKSYASAGVVVISSADEIQNIPAAEKYIAVSQTTQDEEQFNIIVEKLVTQLSNVKIFNTICDSTHNRQKDIREGIEKNIDALVVVGGKHSANTLRLAQMSRECGVKTFHVETEAELNAVDFKDVDHVLVTAGASTPGWIINNVIERLYDIKYRNTNKIISFFIKVLEFTIRTSLHSAAAAAFISLFSQKFIKHELDFIPALISFLYIFAMYTINNFLEMEFLLVRNPVKYSSLNKYKKLVMPLAVISLAVSFVMVSRYSIPVIVIYSVLCVTGTMYSTGLVKGIVYKLKFSMVKRLYELKNIVSAFGWLICTTLMPLMILRADPYSYIALGSFIFSLILLRNIMLDTIAFQGDLIFGRQTLPTMLGIKRTEIATWVIASLSAVIFGTCTLLRGEYIYLLFLLNLLYPGIVYNRISVKNNLVGLKNEVLLDVNFILFVAVYFLV